MACNGLSSRVKTLDCASSDSVLLLSFPYWLFATHLIRLKRKCIPSTSRRKRLNLSSTAQRHSYRLNSPCSLKNHPCERFFFSFADLTESRGPSCRGQNMAKQTLSFTLLRRLKLSSRSLCRKLASCSCLPVPQLSLLTKTTFFL